MLTELEKYKTIYGDTTGRWGRYGHKNHGRDALPLVREVPSLLDVGCGHNEFATKCRSLGIAATGVDFACPSADVIASAEALPFEDKSFHTLTAFDMLEHLLPEQVEPVLREFARLSHHFVFSISYVPSIHKVAGETLHPCVRPEDWWIQRIHEAGGTVQKTGKYLHGDWAG
jgi:ubiquinone/menaquinone biosynthesis C-methylase UbiE